MTCGIERRGRGGGGGGVSESSVGPGVRWVFS